MRRAGRWIDFENDYKTLNLEFMETVWWVFSQISKQGLVYRGMKVLSEAISHIQILSKYLTKSQELLY